MSNPDPNLERLKERAWQEVAEINQALEEGRMDEAGWHEAMAALIKPAYLAADNPYAQAGHGGDAATWEASRGFIAEALHRSGTFLDVGCASGILMESVHRWGAARNLVIEPYDLDIVPEFVGAKRNGECYSWRPVQASPFFIIQRELF
jgi:2-polyprenyl-3-methyl-5-hydroxy-6-metoxy-1,4-benzoquinol methylase